MGRSALLTIKQERLLNKYLYRAKLKEIRDFAKDPAGATGVHVNGKRWHTTPVNALFSKIKLQGNGSWLRMVFGQRDLYVQGFENQYGSFKFTDATWNIAATGVGFTSDYASMGWPRLSAFKGFSFDDIAVAIDNIATCNTTIKWAAQKQSIVRLVIAFAEGARMHSIQQLVEEGKDIANVKWDATANELALIKG